MDLADTDAKASTAVAFKNSLLQLVAEAAAAWPEDPLLPVAGQALGALEPVVLIEAFQKRFVANQDLAQALGRHDDAAAVDLAGADAVLGPLVAPLDLAAKWARVDPATKATLWDNLDHLVRFTTMYGMYQQIPDSILGVISSTASVLKSQIETGSLDLASVNPLALGQQVLAQVRPEQLQAMVESMTANQDQMAALVSQIGMLMPSDSSAGPALNALGPLGGLSGLLGALGPR